MTSTQAMLPARLRGWIAPTLAALGCLVSACARHETVLTPPQRTVAPYPTGGVDVLWAAAPLRNECGTSDPDIAALSDKLVAALEEVEGVRTVPLNRTIEAMRALGLDQGLKAPADARKLAQAMGVDGVVVGSLTAWDPYTPTLGLTLGLIARPGAMREESPKPLDPHDLAASGTGQQPAPERFSDRPLSSVSEHLDAKNHQVLLDVKTYANGRSDPESALHWERYTKSMALYEEFAMHYAVGRLIQSEELRLAKAGASSKDQTPPRRSGRDHAGSN